jgi:ribosomal protein S18 acetylase RimI-like enzyme
MYQTKVIPETALDSLYAQYIKEREGKDILFHIEGTSPVGFLTYKEVGPGEKVLPGIYIIDIFVKAGYRDRGIAKKMADQICEKAKAQNVDWVYGSCDIQANGAETSAQVLLAYGFKFKYIDRSLLFFEKFVR